VLFDNSCLVGINCCCRVHLCSSYHSNETWHFALAAIHSACLIRLMREPLPHIRERRAPAVHAPMRIEVSDRRECAWQRLHNYPALLIMC
jgi:hypothetical protein